MSNVGKGVDRQGLVHSWWVCDVRLSLSQSVWCELVEARCAILKPANSTFLFKICPCPRNSCMDAPEVVSKGVSCSMVRKRRKCEII